MFVVETSDSVVPKGQSMQRKSAPLLIKGADDDSGTFTGLASVFDNLDHDGDIVRRGAFSKSLGSSTRRYHWCGCTRLMTHATMSVMSSRYGVGKETRGRPRSRSLNDRPWISAPTRTHRKLPPVSWDRLNRGRGVRPTPVCVASTLFASLVEPHT